MKKIIAAFILLISLNAFAQDSSYNNLVKFNMTDSIENGITFQRKAYFEGMNYNQRTSSISFFYTVEFFNSNGASKMKLVKPYTVEHIITNREYVVSATGVYVGSINDVLVKYGKRDTTFIVDTLGVQHIQSIKYRTFADGRYDLTTKCMGYYDYLTKGFDANQKLHAVIKSIGQTAASEGKLN